MEATYTVTVRFKDALKPSVDALLNEAKAAFKGRTDITQVEFDGYKERLLQLCMDAMFFEPPFHTSQKDRS